MVCFCSVSKRCTNTTYRYRGSPHNRQSRYPIWHSETPQRSHTGREVEAQLLSFLHLAPDERECLPSRTGRFTNVENVSRTHWTGWLGPGGGMEGSEKRKSALAGNRTRNIPARGIIKDKSDGRAGNRCCKVTRVLWNKAEHSVARWGSLCGPWWPKEITFIFEKKKKFSTINTK